MFNELTARYPTLKECESEIRNAVGAVINCYSRGRKVMICGNGGSAADADHIVGELMKGFLKKRPLSEDEKAQMLERNQGICEDTLDKLQGGLPAIALSSIGALNSAFCNDVDPKLVYAQALLALAKEGDVLIAISTSGNAENVLQAANMAKALGVTVIALTGKTGGELKGVSDISIQVPETETFKVQELHLPVYHYLCAEVEANFYSI